MPAAATPPDGPPAGSTTGGGRSDALALLDDIVTARGGSGRAGQQTMCAAVADALDADSHLVVEAPTGTGKSLAYLAAAIATSRRAVAEGRAAGLDDDEIGRQSRVVVCTTTKNLQDQLAEIDAPAAIEAANAQASPGGPSRVAVIKGRANYACLQAIDDNHARLAASRDGAALLDWVERTGTGDRGELVVGDDTWRAASVGPGECPGAAACPRGEECFSEGARRDAAGAQVIIANAALYLSWVAHGGSSLPPHRAVIFDEAHELVDVATSTWGARLTGGLVARLATFQQRNRAGRASTPAGDDGDGQADGEGPRPGGAARTLELARTIDTTLAGRDGRVTLDGDLGALVGALDVHLAGVTFAEHADPRAVAYLEHCRETLRRVVEADVDAGGRDVAWIENGALCVAPIDVSGLLAERIWSQRASIATSATLSVGTKDGPSLAPSSAELGYRGPTAAAALVVDSPFDHRAQGLLYVPAALPDPRDDTWRARVADEIEALAAAAGGRTLGLFTSWSATREAAERLRDRGVDVLVQGEAPRDELLDAFRAGGAVLCATQSWWTGVDLPGRDLVCVVVDRIPFPRPDDPVVSARRDAATAAGRNAFSDVDVPHAARRLAQGTGRLLRTPGDVGVICVCDRRLAEAGYRGLLLASLPPYKRTRDRDDAVELLARA